MQNEIRGLGLIKSFWIFGTASLALILYTQLLIPFLSDQTGFEPIIFWFLVAGLGIFFPMLILSYFILRSEGIKIGGKTWRDRLRFKKMDKRDWQWTMGSILIIGILSFAIIKLLEVFLGKVDSQPSFIYFEPLTPDRYWILLIWLPYWILNIMGEEILWRGVILPRQEKIFKKNTWLIHGAFWGIFHIAFGWQILLTVIPILYIQSYVVQRRKNSWIGVVIHAVINGPSFIAISFGLL
jgi:membrane protease YdiL (CAAX protease family)